MSNGANTSLVDVVAKITDKKKNVPRVSPRMIFNILLYLNIFYIVLTCQQEDFQVSGGKNKKNDKKTKQIYVQTDKRFGRRIIYTRGGKDFIREKRMVNADISESDHNLSLNQ